MQRAALRSSQARRAAIMNLAVARDDEVMPDYDFSSELMSVLAVIGRQIDVEFRAPRYGVDGAQTIHDKIAAIARVSGSRARRVLLQPGWISQDFGTVLAFRKADNSPVALVSRRRLFGLDRRMEVVDAAGNARPATEALYTELADDAYTFITPLPGTEEKLSFLRLSKFAFSPFFADLRLMMLLSLAVPCSTCWCRSPAS